MQVSVRVSVQRAAVVPTTAVAVAAGTACGLFWAAFHDPVAIGWVLTPFIGAFWGCVAGLLVGALLRLALRAGVGDRSLPRWALAAVVVAVAAATALVLAGLYATDSSITAAEAAQASGLAVGVSAGVAVLCQVVLLRRAARPRPAAGG